MAILGAQGIRDSIHRTYRKHLRMFQEEGAPLEEGMTPHHASLHGALTMRYAASYRARPAAVVWLELAPFVELPPEEALQALAEYVVFRERPKLADLEILGSHIRRGLALLTEEDRRLFSSAAESYGFPWLRLAE